MRKLAIAALLLASCTLATAQENRTDPETPKSGNWFTRLWSSDKPAPKKAVETKKSEPSAAEILANLHAKEEAALNRRNAVILKLHEIAIRTHDDALLQKADELEERAWQLYLQKQPQSHINEFRPSGFSSTSDTATREGKR